MCGIFGVISKGNVNIPLTKWFRDAAIAGAVRGTDSFGVLQVETKTNGDTIPYTGRTLMAAGDTDDKQIDRIIRDVDTCSLTVGHNRAATNGGVTIENCHPFAVYCESQNKTIYGVHNGSLTAWNRVEDNIKFEVDSEWALYMIAKHGTDYLNDIKGPFVFVWWDDSNPNMVNIARGTGRPLHIAETSSGNILFASEAGMLSWLAQRNHLPLKKSEIFEVPLNTLVSLDITEPNLDDANVSKITPKIVHYPSQNGSNYSNFMGASSRYGAYYDDDGWGRWDEYEDYRYTSIKDRVKNLISGSVKKLERQSNETLTDTPTEPEQISKNRMLPSSGSIELAEQLGLRGVEVTFIPLTYDDIRETMYGECMDNDGQVMAHSIMVNVDETLAKALLLSDYAVSKIYGATAYDSPGSDEIPDTENMTVFLSRPSTISSTHTERSKEIDKLMGKDSVTAIH